VSWRAGLRRPPDAGEQRTTSLELFYDLAFVFAVTQVSHLLLDDLSWRGAGRAALALLVVWWAWNYTTWASNELDTDSTGVRLMLLAVMLASLLLAVSIPEAFGSRALLFACSYAAIQVGRHLFLTYVASERGTIERRRAARILAWLAASSTLWVLGAAVGGTARIWLWLAALAIDYGGPLVLYRIPGRPPLDGSAWTVQTAHFAERFQLFLIIALGESIVLTGATTAELELDAARAAAFALAFISTAALWWLYFDYAARIAERRLALAQDAERTLAARDAYTYLHVVLAGGVILSAVGAEIVIAHPREALGTAETLAVVAGPALYLLANALFRLRLAHSIAWKRLAGAAACLAAAALGGALDALWLAAVLDAILVGVIAAERLAARRRRRRGEPTPLERLQASVG
jgi:low temperature requirement protein LtrA